MVNDRVLAEVDTYFMRDISRRRQGSKMPNVRLDDYDLNYGKRKIVLELGKSKKRIRESSSYRSKKVGCEILV